MLSEPPAEGGELPRLALLAQAMGEREYCDRLSSREAAHLGRLKNAGVRRRWLAGRLAAKSLWLSRPQRSPRLVVLEPSELAALPAPACREIEILAERDRPPRLSWRGKELGSPISISHAGGYSSAALTAPGAAAGLDLEAVAPRVAAFYRQSFTARERRWVEQGARASGLTAAWLYTLLWTVKEAAFKSGATSVRGAWELGRLEAQLPDDLAERLAASCRPALGQCFASFETSITSPLRSTSARVETTATPEVILSLFNASEARL